MQFIKTLVLAVALLSVILPSDAQSRILPCPLVYQSSIESFRLGKKVKLYCSPLLKKEGKYLKDWLKEACGVDVTLCRHPQKATIRMIHNVNVLPGREESYQLDVNSESVVIESNSAAGSFYGIQTLRQLLQTDGGECSFRGGHIEDAPRFSWRGFMLDEARNFKGKEVVKRLLDEMAALKMNVFHWHLTNDQGWRIEIKKYPRLTAVGAYRDSTELYHFKSNVYDGLPHGGFYTQKDLKEMVRYAEDRHITIVPEITLPGHLTAACAAYPWLGTSGKTVKVSPRFGAHYNALNVALPEVYDFLSDVFDEVIAIFPSPYIHIGGDEVRYQQWNESSQIQQFMEEHQLHSGAELQVYFTNRLSEMLEQKGRNLMGWNEITGDRLHAYQVQNDGKQMEAVLAKGTLVQFWQGSPKLINKAIEKGYDIVNSYNTYTYLDYDYGRISLRKAYDFEPVPAGLDEEKAQKVKGLGCQMWGEFIPTVEQMNKMVFPRIAAYAEVGWTTKENRNYENFLQSLQPILKRWQERGINYGPVEELK